jgi:hypothetical protein
MVTETHAYMLPPTGGARNVIYKTWIVIYLFHFEPQQITFT